MLTLTELSLRITSIPKSLFFLIILHDIFSLDNWFRDHFALGCLLMPSLNGPRFQPQWSKVCLSLWKIFYSSYLKLLQLSPSQLLVSLFFIEASFCCPIATSTGYLNEWAVVPSKFIRVWTTSLNQGCSPAKKEAVGTGSNPVPMAQIHRNLWEH